MELLKYSYYDTPEGSDLFHKLFYTCKYASAVTFASGTYDVMLYSNPKGYIPILTRYLKHGVPIIGMTAAFTATTFMAANIRKKDDELNYALGSVAASSVFGAVQKSVYQGYRMGILLTVLLVMKKYTKLNDTNYLIVKNPMPMLPGEASWIRNWDFTITKDDVPRGWTRNPEEA